jgi:hypothetical protein
MSGARLALVALWGLASVVMLAFVGRVLVYKITWYLAVDQYGYLAFAHDLVQGKVFHDWPPLAPLASRLPEKVDVLSQTYVYDGGRLYCRYAPGFPIILATWLLFFGDDGAHYLNPTVYVVLMALLLVFQKRLFRSRWRALTGVALVTLFPTYLHLWGITLVRDLATHTVAIVGLFLLLPVGGKPLGWRRALAAGGAFGYAVAIRPDAVLYLVPALAVAATRWQHEGAGRRVVVRGLAAGVLGLLIGLAPLLAYNWIATGNPLRPTQGMELKNFLPGLGDDVSAADPPPALADPPPAQVARAAYPPGAWRGGTHEAVQGGGLRLSNLPRILPGNVRLLRGAYGDVLLGVALWGAVVAFLRRRLVLLVVGPYVILAVLLYSCWSRPDTRYLSGVHCLLPMLVVEGIFGTLDLARRLWRTHRPTAARAVPLAVAAALVLGVLVVHVPAPKTALPVLAVLVPLAAAAAAVAAAALPGRRVVAVAGPLLALVLVGLSIERANASLEYRAAFQRPEMLRSRSILNRAVGPGAVIITSEEVGRPGENIDYYSGVARAFYITDLVRWRITIAQAAKLFLNASMVPYLLVPPSEPHHEGMLENLRKQFSVELVADIPPERAMDYFVAAPFHRGVRMELYRLGPLPGRAG